jgi:uncharacterized integral membrane protein
MTVNSDPPSDAPQPTPQSPAPPPAAVGRTRLGGLWLMLVLGAVILVLLLVFILMNGQHVQVHLYGAHWDAPLGVALLLAAALGLLLVVVPGGGRIIQLRRAARHLHKEREVLANQLGQSATEAGTTADGSAAAADASAAPNAGAASSAPGANADTTAPPAR